MHCSISGSGALLLEGLAGTRSIISRKQLGRARFVEAFLRFRENGWRAHGTILCGLPDAVFHHDQAVTGPASDWLTSQTNRVVDVMYAAMGGDLFESFS